jgi:2-pyrone-4,6-dicarboxylate lactonase
MDGPRIGELSASLAASPVPVVIDHMGRVDASRGLESPEFKALLGLMKHQHVWVKVSGPERISKQQAPWKDARPFQRKLVAEFGDRAVWGTDWPHPNLDEVPDDGDLVDALAEAAPSEAERKAVLVDNPKRLYGF